MYKGLKQKILALKDPFSREITNRQHRPLTRQEIFKLWEKECIVKKGLLGRIVSELLLWNLGSEGITTWIQNAGHKTKYHHTAVLEEVSWGKYQWAYYTKIHDNKDLWGTWNVKAYS